MEADKDLDDQTLEQTLEWFEQSSQREREKKLKKKLKKQRQKEKKRQEVVLHAEEVEELQEQAEHQEKVELNDSSVKLKEQMEQVDIDMEDQAGPSSYLEQAQNEEGIEEEIQQIELAQDIANDQNEDDNIPDDDDDHDQDQGQDQVPSSKKSKKKSRKRKAKMQHLHTSDEEQQEKITQMDAYELQGQGLLDVKRILNRVSGVKQVGECEFMVGKGYVKGMKVDARFYASNLLLDQLISEVEAPGGNFSPAMQQLANVATLPGIIGASLGMPDIHSGYGFAIGNIAAMDMDDPDAVVSPGGVGFDINCGVRLLRTNLSESDIVQNQQKLADVVYAAVPVGVGADSLCRLNKAELDQVLNDGMKWAERSGHCWPEDRQHVEEGGCFKTAVAEQVSSRAKQRGQGQVGSLGSGNHYVEVQVVDEVYDQKAADCMGIGKVGQVCVMLHSGSRGLGHQVCTDALQKCESIMKRKNINIVDKQLACAPITSREGKEYLGAMAAAANFAFCNRTLLAEEVRTAFAQVFGKSALDLDMHVVYDVAHNIAKMEEHRLNGETKRVLVHRKGATRAFAPGHKEIPEKYQEIGQPVLIGGSMGTCSYVLTGTQKAMEMTFGSTCHGAGRTQTKRRNQTGTGPPKRGYACLRSRSQRNTGKVLRDRVAGFDRRVDGDVQLRVDGNVESDGDDVREYVSWRGESDESEQSDESVGFQERSWKTFQWRYCCAYLNQTLGC
eukprot:TRINITY_DN3476_c1_g1_i4.p1 TRINITY_DN3476_c1_g1~~TRINITY_DN3476_c1_g1_i4.p1  ORF type:complete len:755 (+),score=136.04 TRINITY_DN3476_c1_g1_i4:86-2266(+)